MQSKCQCSVSALGMFLKQGWQQIDLSRHQTSVGILGCDGTMSHLAVMFMLFMSPSSSRNFSSSSLIVSTRVFSRTMRVLMRRILSRSKVVTCRHKQTVKESHPMQEQLTGTADIINSNNNQNNSNYTCQHMC